MIIASLLCLALVMVLVYGLYKIRIQNQEVENLETQAESLGQMDDIVQSVRSIKINAGADLASLDNLILSQSKMVSFISMVESLGKQMGLKIVTASVATDKASVHITFDTDGVWSRTMDFVHALENLPYKITLDESTISSTGGTSHGWHGHIIVTAPTL